MKKLAALLLTMTLLAGCSAGAPENGAPPATSGTVPTVQDTAPVIQGVQISLSDEGITVDGQAISTDPAQAVYAANDIVYYPAGQDHTYGEGTGADAHTPQEAQGHTVVHITQPGNYVLSGKLSAGQVAVDLGEGAETDPDAVVTLILNGADITCTVAPAVIFYRVYECGSTETAAVQVDTSAAGANVYLADGTQNSLTGSYVARIYDPDTVILSDDGTEVEQAQKLHKYDGTLYSKMSMNIGGNGLLSIDAENEGVCSDLHLTVNGGDIRIRSGNDGINASEDGLSVVSVNGGRVEVTVTGTTGEGDGIDSNGYLVINAGAVIAAACGTSEDAGIDSDLGIHLNGGTVIATGNMLDRIAGGQRTYAIFRFAQRQTGGNTYSLKNADGNDVIFFTPANDFAYLILSGDGLTPGDYTFWQGDVQLSGAAAQTGGTGGFLQLPGTEGMQSMTPPEGMEIPEGMTPPEGMEFPEGMERPEGMTPPDGMQMPPDAQMPQGGFIGQSPDTVGQFTSTFTIVQGANIFAYVGPAEAP